MVWAKLIRGIGRGSWARGKAGDRIPEETDAKACTGNLRGEEEGSDGHGPNSLVFLDKLGSFIESSQRLHGRKKVHPVDLARHVGQSEGIKHAVSL